MVSVIVPVYNVEKYINRCIDSVINQSFKNWELFLVDDGSSDGSPQICDNYAAIDDRIKVIHKKNGGVAKARNIGLDNAKGDYITFLDSDDFLHINYLDTMLKVLLDFDADIVQCDFFKGVDVSFPKLEETNKISIYNNHSIFLSGNAKVIMCSKLYKKYLFNEIRITEGKFFEDDFTTWKWYFNAKKIAVISQKLYYYTDNVNGTMSAHSSSPNLDFIQAYEQRISFFELQNKKDLEDYSRIHLCKALLLVSSNKNISEQQKLIIDEVFANNWKRSKKSKYLSFSLKLLFLLYNKSPKITNSLLRKLKA